MGNIHVGSNLVVNLLLIQLLYMNSHLDGDFKRLTYSPSPMEKEPTSENTPLLVWKMGEILGMTSRI